MNSIHGLLLIATGVIHVVFGLTATVYGSQWKSFVNARLFGTVWIDDDRSMAAFWFVIFGPVLMALGLAVYELEVQGLGLPLSVGWVLLGLSLLGAVMTPKSGFSLLLVPQAVFYLYSAY